MSKKEKTEKNSSYEATLPLRFLILSIVSTALLSFILGRVSRSLLVHSIAAYVRDSRVIVDDDDGSAMETAHMPRLPLSEGKPFPNTVYTSKHFDTSLTTCDSILLDTPARACKSLSDQTCSNTDAPMQPPEITQRDENHQPVGQHLLVDIKFVDVDFLNSQYRLAKAMVALVRESGATMLSYHCHKLEPLGVSCVGVLLESHISFHTWPTAGVITLDLFTCGGMSLLPLVNFTKRYFGLPQTPFTESPLTHWALKYRGFSDDRQPEDTIDLDQHLLGWADYHMKEQIVEIETDFQLIEVYDVINPRFRELESYERSLANDESYESKNPDLFLPDRVIYMDKIMQSRRYGEKEYHEALVHPAMFAHENPRRVAIVGGGEGATLREVLKHKSVQQVTMIEIDERMVNVSRSVIPEWSSCHEILGEEKSCFDDPRARVLFEDAIAFFTERFSDSIAFTESERFDVIIMDALDPSSVNEFSDVLYNSNMFIASLSNALTDNGILVAQVGQASTFDSTPRDFSKEKVLDDGFIAGLKSRGFSKIKEYVEGHGGFLGVWSFIVAFKDARSSERWYANEAEVDLAVRQRVIPTVSGAPPLHFFDGSMMKSYSFPSRIIEQIFCFKDSNQSNFSSDSVRQWKTHPMTSEVGGLMVLPQAERIIKSLGTVTKQSDLSSFIRNNGLPIDFYGDKAFICDTSNSAIQNTEARLTPQQKFLRSIIEGHIYNPFIDRNFISIINQIKS